MALVMLALWGPVTQHCALDAAGVEMFSSCADDVESCETACASDLCQMLKETSPNSGVASLRAIPAPEFPLYLHPP